MTTHSSNVPTIWQIPTANGRYKEPPFEFENRGSIDRCGRIVNQSSAEYDADDTTTVVLTDGEEQSVTAGQCISTAEALESNEELLLRHQAQIFAQCCPLDDLDVEPLEPIVGRYRYATPEDRIRMLLDTFQSS